MPQALPAIAYAAVNSATGSALAAAFTSALVSAAVSDHQASAQARRAQAAAAEAARSRNITVRSSVAPRRYVLGTARISGPLMYAEFVGTELQYLDSVVALTHGELSEVLGVYVGDEYIAVADIDAGVPTTGKFSASAVTDAYWFDEPFDYPSGTATITLANPPLSLAYVYVSTQTGTEPDIVQTPVTVSSIAGNDINLAATVTGRVNVRYLSNLADYTPPLRVQWAMGSTAQATTTWAGVSTPKWTADHRLRGVSYVRTLKLIDHRIFLAGDSGDVGLVARGPKGVYDPRTDTTLPYTSNPALLAAWWRTLPTADGGLGVPAAWIDWDTVADAANVCDETISVKQLDGTGYENVKRYECHTVLSLDLPALDNLQVILDAMAGDFPFTGGRYRCYAGAFRAATVTITDNDVAQEEPITFAPLASDGENPPNIATARFYDGAHGWVETQAKPVANSTYITADGQEEPLELDLLASTDERQANYLMGVRLERRRPALAGTITVMGKGADLALLDTLQFSMDGYSAIAAKTFEVRRRTNHWNGRYTLNLREIKASTYALDADRFTPATAVTVPDNSVLFSVDMPVIVSCVEQLVRQADGGLVSRALLTWDPHTQASVLERGQVQMRWAAAGAAWVYGSPVAGRETTGHTGVLNDRTMVTVQARAINASGVPSGWASAAPFLVAGKAAAPANVASLAATQVSGGVLVTWAANSELDYLDTEIRSGASWAAGALVWRGAADRYLWPWPDAGSITLWVAHRDTSKGYSATPQTATVTVDDGLLMTVVLTDNHDFAGTGFGTGTARTFTVTPAVDCTVEFFATTTADNVLGDAGNTFGWFVTPAAGSPVYLGGSATNSTAKQVFTAGNAFTAVGGVALDFTIEVTRPGGNPSIHFFESFLRVSLIQR